MLRPFSINEESVGRFPLIISRTKTPKLYTSVFSVALPLCMYSASKQISHALQGNIKLKAQYCARRQNLSSHLIKKVDIAKRRKFHVIMSYQDQPKKNQTFSTCLVRA
jgi:hypothetical protein